MKRSMIIKKVAALEIGQTIYIKDLVIQRREDICDAVAYYMGFGNIYDHTIFDFDTVVNWVLRNN
jgi:hypothetical protein